MERKHLSHLYLRVCFRLQSETVGWNVTDLLSLNGDSFGPKGPLEVSSELLIQHSFRGELRAVSQILQKGAVYPDVADARGQTALIAATVTSPSFSFPPLQGRIQVFFYQGHKQNNGGKMKFEFHLNELWAEI